MKISFLPKVVFLLVVISCAPQATPTALPSTPTPILQPTPTLGPAPKVDRVGFPEAYSTQFQVLYMFDRPGNKQSRVVYGNDKAIARKPGEPYPYGSTIVIEHYSTKQDAQGNVLKDARGRYIRDRLTNLFVMRKEPGFGADYQHLRTDEWEYAAYNPDGTPFLPPERTAFCSACHQIAGAERDWVFRGDLFFTQEKYVTPPPLGPNEIGLDSISFYPASVTVKPGTTVKWVNNDQVTHTVTARNGAFASPPLKPGESFSFTFSSTGVFEYFCSIHPQQMQAKIDVAK
ncbi:MAG: cytochrome P460 family protein [Chloroflexi bacterium]|nr:cytochrome P460 family protein [Chloroflexota bacterium]